MPKKLYMLINICKNRKNIFNPLFVLETNKGYLTHIQACQFRIGGNYLGTIYL